MPQSSSRVFMTEHIIQRDDKGHFLPGTTANPNGRPPDSVSLVTILKRRLRERPEDADAIINSLIQMGKTRELGAIKELLDRIDGKVAETHRIEGELPIKLIFIPAGEMNALQGQPERPRLAQGQDAGAETDFEAK